MTPMSAIFDATLSVARSGGSRGATFWPFSYCCIDVLLLLVARLADVRNDSTRGRGQLRLECKQFKETQRGKGGSVMEGFFVAHGPAVHSTCYVGLVNEP
jgi:hypothetical protein